MEYSISKLSSPIGELNFICSKEYLLFLTFGKLKYSQFDQFKDKYLTHEYKGTYPVVYKVINQLNEYFNKERTKFSIPIKLFCSEFQKSVLYVIKNIPYGNTKSYSEIAKIIDNPLSSRAVGNATGKNPIPIIIPCHRVIKKDNSIGGFTGGLEIKKYLLNLERSI
ncbi:MAG: methylated-DNA--[protein]-cysteine S-methyltransferase [Candidatus Marinimicrobia bacterium]|jgi:O-6-methylguanine DNA methyltransferase|nr:methylated-DNA--[protein]-cysteine S-methyltransferase [Candidatus Neomarinimicrobiota bacterium]